MPSPRRLGRFDLIVYLLSALALGGVAWMAGAAFTGAIVWAPVP